MYTRTPQTNYGTTSPLQLSRFVYHGLLRFDLSAIPAGSNITSATLRLYSKKALPGSFVVTNESDDWSESAVTASEQPAWQPAILATSTPLGEDTYASAPLPLAAVTHRGTMSFGLSTTPFLQAQVSSRESNHPPQLVLTYVPQPTTISTTAPTTPATTTTAVKTTATTAETTTRPTMTTTRTTATPTTATRTSTPSTPITTARTTTATSTTSTSSAVSTPPTTSGTTSSAPGTTRVSKILVILEENHSLSQMTLGMPYLYGLGKQYGYASDYHALTHPSEPNYLAIAAGDTFGIADDNDPSSHMLGGATVFGQAITAGKTAKSYMEAMPGPCTLTGNVDNGYAVKHNPWAFFVNERSLCNSFDVPAAGSLAQDASGDSLPNVGFLSPDKCNDAHDCTVATADAYLKAQLPAILGSADFTSGRLAIVVTADEDDTKSGNGVLTVVMAKGLDHKVVGTALNHLSLSKMLSQVSGSAPLRSAGSAPDMAAAFGLTVGPASG